MVSKPLASAQAMRVLVIDDEPSIRRSLATCLARDGHAASSVATAEDAMAEIGRHIFDVAFVDLRLGASNGLDLIPTLLTAAPWLRVVVITAYATVDTAVEAMRRGASNYIQKPFSPDQIRLVMHRMAELRGLETRLEAAERDLGRVAPPLVLTSSSPTMQRVVELAHQIAGSEATVLLRGESGTGKTELARAIHAWSPRRDYPLAVVSCPSIATELLESELFGHRRGAFTGAVRDSPGRIAACEGGTLLLDEIGDLSPALQPKLLRFLEDHEYEPVGDHHTRRADVRVLAATNRDLEAAVVAGGFREDFFYRLNVFPLVVPPLRERPEDIPALAREMVEFFARVNHAPARLLSEPALDRLVSYQWHGNLRELRNVVERAVILCRGAEVGPEHLPEDLEPARREVHIGDPVELATVEEAHIRAVLATVPSLQEAARVLGIDPATLFRKRRTWGI